MHPLLNTAIKAARRAGSIITRASEDISSLTITSKNMNDFVSEVDLASEKEIIRVLKQAYPDHGFLAEESGSSEKKENMWIIDPLDGTTNFLHNIPQYCVSIALKQKDEITHAVVYDPNRNDLFTASKGQGAYLNDRRIRVSKSPKLQDSIIGTGIPVFLKALNFKIQLLELAFLSETLLIFPNISSSSKRLLGKLLVSDVLVLLHLI